MTPASSATSHDTPTNLRLFALLSIIGTVTFAGVVLLLHLLSPEFDPTTRFISEYGLGPYGYLLTIGFLALGIGSIFLVAALSCLENTGEFMWKSGLVLLTIWGLSVTLDGIFPIDKGVQPVTRSGEIHLMAAMIAFLSLMIASLLLSLSFRRMPSWKRMVPTALLLVVLIVVLFAISAILDTVLQGLTQRLFVLACLAWLLYVARGVRSSAPK
jgi:hypothetical membrane protein